ncbi:MAG TPA: hypothetical protein VK658_27915, partial [Chryseolinea sp.]|nr:hypothetical protein [Chryseolinea sp.]
MTDFYKVVSRLALLLLLVAPGYALRAQCVISNLQPSYCSDDAAVTLTGGDNVYGPGIAGGTFSPSIAGVGTHTIYSSSYSVSTAGTFGPDPTVGTATSFGANEDSAPIPLGFNFDFFGQTYSTLVVNANGYVTFGPDAGTGTSQSLPSASTPNNLIAGAWDDLNVTLGGTIHTAMVGIAPNRRFLITFDNVRYASGPQTVTFQIQLYETSQVIEIHSTDIQDNGGSGATQGIENPTGMGGYADPSRNATAWTATSDYVSFAPSCTNVYPVTVSAPPSNSLGITAPATVCPSTGAPVTIFGTQLGVEYQLQVVSTSAVLSSFYAGTGGDLNIVSNNLPASTNIKVYARHSVTGCDTDLSATVTVNLSPLPSNSLGVTAPATICPSSGAPVTIAGTQVGVLYQLQEASTSAVLSSFYAGTGGNLTITSNTLPGATNIKVYARNSTTGCDANLSTTVNVDPSLVPPSIIGQPSSAIVCQNGTTSFTVNAGVTTGGTFQWQVSTNGGVTYGNLSDDATYNGSATASLSVSTTPLSFNGYRYRVIVSGGCTP